MRSAVIWVVFLLVQTQLSAIQVETYRREEIIPLLPMLNAWADREFAQYPYLLFPSDEQIVCPSDLVFVNSRDAMIAVAKEEDKIVGLAAMISFDAPVVHALYFN